MQAKKDNESNREIMLNKSGIRRCEYCGGYMFAGLWRDDATIE